MLAIGFAIAMVSRRWRRLKRGDIPDFLTVFLMFQVANKLMTIVALAFGERYMSGYELSDLVGPIYNFRAEWVHLAAMVLFALGWIVIERSARNTTSSPHSSYSPSMLLVFYVASSLITFLLQASSGVLATGLLSTFMQFSTLGAVGLLLTSDSRWGLGGSRAMLTLLLLVPYFYLAMLSGTKGQMIVVTLPVLIAGIGHGWKRVTLILAPLAVFMLAIGIPLSQEIRSANWESTGGTEDIGLREGLSRVFEQYARGEGFQIVGKTLVIFSSRASSAEMGGVVMRYADRDGLIGTETLRLLPAVFIPRLLWPDKPVFRPGAWFTWYEGRAASPETATSATAMMLGTEFYWSFGVWGLLLLFFLGVLYAVVWSALTRVSAMGLMGFAGMYALLATAVRFEESNAVYAVSYPVAFLAYAYALVWAERVARKFLIKTKVRQ